MSLADALLAGPAPDGGLYLPEALPAAAYAEPAERSGPRSFASVAADVLSPYLAPTMSRHETAGLVADALDFPLPLMKVDRATWVLELTHGPSGAFKDVGARVLARLLARLAPPAEASTRTVLVATSGDTGGAVARAFQGLTGIRVEVLFPLHGVSPVQRRLFTRPGGNVRALAVRGSFDDCQRLARAAFADPVLRRRAGLTSANSLNIGRLLPQMTYYHWAALRLAADGVARPAFVVPSGNLGNLTAGYMAGRAGLPHAGFLAALNANDAFARYLRDGGVDDARPTVPTLSNAMDVGRPSNLERLRHLVADDYTALGATVSALSIDDADTRSSMRRLADDHGYLADPHTAVAAAALTRWRAEAPARADTPVVMLSTAHPGKFPELVLDVTGRAPPVPPGLHDLADGDETWTEIDAEPAALAALLVSRGDP